METANHSARKPSAFESFIVEYGFLSLSLLLISPTILIVTGIVSLFTHNPNVFGIGMLVSFVNLGYWLMVLRSRNAVEAYVLATKNDK